MPEPITITPFGHVDHQPVDRYTLTNGPVSAAITNYGATLLALHCPDRYGQTADITLGFDTLAGYLGEHPYFGSTVGRVANRIARGQFVLDGRSYSLAVNNGPNHLHGGPTGFHRRVWQASATETATGPAVMLRYLSPAGEEGYPGALTVTVVYTLTPRAELQIDFSAHSDAPTPVNLTNHTYFNLAGHGDVLDHEVQILADAFVPVDATQIPTGEIRAVVGTPMDLRTPTRLRDRIGLPDAQLRIGHGFDHSWLADRPAGQRVLIARVSAPVSGRTLEVETTQPAVQLYTGNFLTGLPGRAGQHYGKHAGLCLETQHLPDSPNQPHFPDTTLRPGLRYQHQVIYRLGW
jgi:aldose 1-epimerase